MTQLNELGYYLMGAAVLSVIGLTFFYFWPTSVPSWDIDWTQYPTLFFLKESDASGNACPSLHVAFSLYAGLWLSRIFRLLHISQIWHILNVIWCLLIILSTMTTKQHVCVDVLCGAVLGVFVFWLNDRLIKALS
ncbi:phosphatase PAP2 family protein [Coraliomargarita sp. W4R72]